MIINEMISICPKDQHILGDLICNGSYIIEFELLGVAIGITGFIGITSMLDSPINNWGFSGFFAKYKIEKRTCVQLH